MGAEISFGRWVRREALDLPGPSRRIRVEPLRRPDPGPAPKLPEAPPAEPPQREPAPEPPRREPAPQPKEPVPA